jgi:hypothetical protein
MFVANFLYDTLAQGVSGGLSLMGTAYAYLQATPQKANEVFTGAQEGLKGAAVKVDKTLRGKPPEELLQLDDPDAAVLDLDAFAAAVSFLEGNNCKELVKLLPSASDAEKGLCHSLAREFRSEQPPDLPRLKAFFQLRNKIVSQNTGYVHRIPKEYQELLSDKGTYLGAASVAAVYATGGLSVAIPAALAVGSYVGAPILKKKAVQVFQENVAEPVKAAVNTNVVEPIKTAVQDNVVKPAKNLFEGEAFQGAKETFNNFQSNARAENLGMKAATMKAAKEVFQENVVKPVQEVFQENVARPARAFFLGNEALQKTREKLTALKTAATAGRLTLAAAKQAAQELLPLVKSIRNDKTIFKTEDRKKRDLKCLDRFIGYLPRFIENNNPNAREFTSLSAEVLEICDHYANAPSKMRQKVNEIRTGAPEKGTLAYYLGQGIDLIQGALSTIGLGPVTAQTLNYASGVVISYLQMAADAMEEGSSDKQKLERIITGLNSAQGNGQELLRLMKLAYDVIIKSGINVYVDQFSVFGANPSDGSKGLEAEAAYKENMKILKHGSKPARKAPENQDWQDLATKEKDKLISNTTNFLTMKHVYENVCGLKPLTESMYLNLMAEAMKSTTLSPEEALEEAFFKKISSNKKVGYFTQFWAKCSYWFFGKMIKRYISNITTVYLEEAFKYIAGHSKDGFQTLKTTAIDNLTRYLTILGGSYGRIADDPNAQGLSREMLSKELEKKESNLGIETEELYQEFAEIVIEKTTGSRILAWIAKKLIGNPEKIVRTIIDQATGSLHNPQGYTHALNSVIAGQLDAMWDILQNPKEAEENDDEPRLVHFSEGQKNQLSAFVKYLLEALPKSKCISSGTLGELKQLTHGKSWIGRANQAIDGLVIEDAIGQATTVLAAAIESLITEKQLNQLIYKFASLANQTFQVGQTVTHQEMRNTEERIAKRSNQILSFAIDGAINGKFNSPRKVQQEKANKQIEKLKERSEEYFDETAIALEELSHLDLSLPDATNKIDMIVEQTEAFCSFGLNGLLESKTTGLHADDQAKFAKMNQEIAKESQKLTKALTTLKSHSNRLEKLDTTTNYLDEISSDLQMIGMKAFWKKDPSEKDFEEMERRFPKMTKNAEDLCALWSHLDTAAIDELFAPAKSSDVEAALNQLRSRAEEQNAAGDAKIVKLLINIRSHLSLGNANPSLQEISRAENHFRELQKLDTSDPAIRSLLDRRAKIAKMMKQLRKKALANKIRQQTEDAAHMLNEVRQIALCRALNQDCKSRNSALSTIVDAQRISILRNNAVGNSIPASQWNQLQQQINGIADAPLKSSLTSSLKKIASAKTIQALDAAKLQFLSQIGEAASRAEASSDEAKRVYEESLTAINQEIERSGQRNPDRPANEAQVMKRAIQEARAEVRRLQPLVKDRLQALSLIDATPKAIKSIKDWALNGTSNFVHKRVKDKVDGILGFLKQEETYRYGLLHHMILLPYVNRVRNR